MHPPGPGSDPAGKCPICEGHVQRRCQFGKGWAFLAVADRYRQNLPRQGQSFWLCVCTRPPRPGPSGGSGAVRHPQPCPSRSHWELCHQLPGESLGSDSVSRERHGHRQRNEKAAAVTSARFSRGRGRRSLCVSARRMHPERPRRSRHRSGPDGVFPSPLTQPWGARGLPVCWGISMPL